jgi:hypothetical protein
MQHWELCNLSAVPIVESQLFQSLPSSKHLQLFSPTVATIMSMLPLQTFHGQLQTLLHKLEIILGKVATSLRLPPVENRTLQQARQVA